MSLDYTQAEAYQAYVEQFADDLISRLYYGFPTAELVRMHEGVKGRKVLTEIVIGSNVVKRWRKEFDGTADVDFNPRTLSVVPAKVEVPITPQELESSYLGFLRQTGQDPRDFPIQAFVLNNIIEKAHEEIESAVWGGVDNGAPAALDNLEDMFDGFMHILDDAITATDITAVATGAITPANIVSKVEETFDALGDAEKTRQTICCVSPQNFINYNRTYRNDYGKYTNPNNMREQLDFAPCTLVGLPGMTGSDKIIITSRDNLHIGIDSPSDHNAFRMEVDHRTIDFWMDFKIGVQIGQLRDGIIAVNDQ